MAWCSLMLMLASFFCLGDANPRLNVPRVLLPFSSKQSQFTLSADSGCYIWSVNRPDIGITQNEYPCSLSAVIIANSTSSGAKISGTVIAEDKTAELTLRADVIIDFIKSLKIVTKTHELYKEETPEMFEVRAYDEYRNEFSTVEGLAFKWNIETGRPGVEILRFMTWSSSPYNTEPGLEELETLGYQGNKVLLEGVKTGTGRVSVRLSDSLYSDPSTVPSTSESLMVVANLFLDPPLARILPGATLKYSANQYKGSKVIKVPLPSPHHELLVDAALADLDQGSATVTGLNPGRGQVTLMDQNMDAEVKTPTADLHVVLPASIEIVCLPYKSCSMQVGMQYQLRVEIFDVDTYSIYPSDNLVIEMTIDSEAITVTHSLANGTLHDIVPRVAGSIPVKAVLRGVLINGVLRQIQTGLERTAMLDVFDKVVIDPKALLLPWQPAAGQYSIKFKVTGGRSPYAWSSNNTAIAKVSQTGVGSVAVTEVGEAKVIAAMARSSHNRDESAVSVVPATALKFLESELEFEVGTELVLPIGLYHADHMFYRCDLVPFNTILTDDQTFQGKAIVQSNTGCAGLPVTANEVSHTKITAAYNYIKGEEKVGLKDSITVASYRPLTVISPNSGETVLAVGSGRVLAFTGGPQPWPHAPSLHYKRMEVEKQSKTESEDLVTVEEHRESSPGHYLYKVTCNAVGEINLRLTVGNERSATLPRPVTASKVVKVICGEPDTIVLDPLVDRPIGLPPCPATATTRRIATHSYMDLKVSVIVKDKDGRVFDSLSTLPVEYQLSDPHLASLEKQNGVIFEDEQKDWYKEPGRPYQILKVKGLTGNLDLTAKIPRPAGGGFMGVRGPDTASHTLALVLVDDVRVEPSSIALFNHSSATKEVRVDQGSGYFYLESLDKGISESQYRSSKNTILLTPVSPGSNTIAVRDLCLSVQRKAQVEVKVYGVYRVELEVVDKLQKGQETTALVKLFGGPGSQELDESALSVTKITVVSENQSGEANEIVTITQGNTLQPIVKGLNLGSTRLKAIVSYNDVVMTSAPAPVHVFSTLKIDPRNITILIGASFQVVTSGGPSAASIEYTVSDNDIAAVRSDGLVTGSTLGRCTLTAIAVGKMPGGRRVEYSVDTIEVNVVPLTSIQLIAPTKEIVSGGEVPIYLHGQYLAVNAFSFASALPHLNTDWSLTSISNPTETRIAKIETGWEAVLDDNKGRADNSHIQGPNIPMVILRGISAGTVVVTATVTISSPLTAAGQYQIMNNVELVASIKITVVDQLVHLQPSPCSSLILMEPGSNFLLRTNRDKGVEYRLVSSTSPDVHLSPQGLITAGASAATAIVTASVRVTEVGAQQDVVWTVQITPVQFLVMKAAQGTGSGWTASRSGTKIPFGGSIDLGITGHDILGRAFHATRLNFGNRPSRFDLAPTNQNGNESLTVRGVSEGFTVWRVKDKERSNLQAWMSADMGQAIVARNYLTVGEVTVFKSTITGPGGEWSARPVEVLDVDARTGVALAKTPGNVRVNYIVDGSSFFIDVTVHPIASIKIATDLALTRSKNARAIPVTLLSDRFDDGRCDQQLPTPLPANVQAKDIFQCKAAWSGDDLGDLESVFHVTSEFLPNEGGWACVFHPSGSGGPSEPSSLTLRIQLASVSGEAALYKRLPGDEANLTYLPPFSLYDGTTSVNVGLSGAGGQLHLAGHPEVLSKLTVRPSEGVVVDVESGWTEEKGFQRFIPIRLSSPLPQDPQVKVALIEANEELTVSIQPTCGIEGPNEKGSLYAIIGDWLKSSYLSLLACLMTLGVSYALFKPTGREAPVLAPKPPPPTIATPSSPTMAATLTSTPDLWSIDRTVIYGSPQSQRSPKNHSSAEYYTYK